MADDKRNKKLDDLLDNSPVRREKRLNELMGSIPKDIDLPEVPKISVALPPNPEKKREGVPEPGSLGKMGLAYTAATSFVAPIIVLSIIGFLLDKKFGHSQGLFVIGGVVIGFIVGVVSLLNVVKKME